MLRNCFARRLSLAYTYDGPISKGRISMTQEWHKLADLALVGEIYNLPEIGQVFV